MDNCVEIELTDALRGSLQQAVQGLGSTYSNWYHWLIVNYGATVFVRVRTDNSRQTCLSFRDPRRATEFLLKYG